jgi:hypothetical protein
VGQWNNDSAQHEIFPLGNSAQTTNPIMTDQQYEGSYDS